MTHNELLEKFTDYEAHFDQVLDEPRIFAMLRAVVELHKPVMALTGGYDGLDNELWAEQCNDCSNNGFSQMYPCPTIQAIEKELQ